MTRPDLPTRGSEVEAVLSTLVLLQHGTKARDPINPGLAEEGRAQVARAAVVLGEAEPARLVSSPMNRAQESIHPLSVITGLPVVVDDRVPDRRDPPRSRP